MLDASTWKCREAYISWKTIQFHLEQVRENIITCIDRTLLAGEHYLSDFFLINCIVFPN